MTLAQGPRDDQSRQDERVRRGASNSTVTICGAEVDVALCLDVQAYVPRSLENLSTLSAEFVERLAERAISFNPQTIQLALRDILSASLILDRVCCLSLASGFISGRKACRGACDWVFGRLARGRLS